MKILVVLVLVAGVVVGALYFGGTSTQGFDPTQQGKDARAAIKIGAQWTEVIEAAGEPQFWRGGPSGFDFVYNDRYEEGTREEIATKLEQKKLGYGFSFLYRYTDAVTFAVNFDGYGEAINIQDKEGKSDLMGG